MLPGLLCSIDSQSLYHSYCSLSLALAPALGPTETIGSGFGLGVHREALGPALIWGLQKQLALGPALIWGLQKQCGLGPALELEPTERNNWL